MADISIENKTYDLREFTKIHPGGEKIISVFSESDATNAYQSYHGRNFPHDKMKKYLTKELLNDDGCIFMDPEYLKLHRDVKEYLKKYLKTDGYAPFEQWIKIFFLIVITLYVELSSLYNRNRSFTSSIIMGILYAWVGLNIQHDANHGAYSRNSRMNEYLGYSQNYIGGSALMWMYEHIVNHHQYTNSMEKDPDIQGGGILRFYKEKENSKARWYHRFQDKYIFVLESLFGYLVVITTPFELYTNKYGLKYKLPSAVEKWRRKEQVMNILFLVRFFLLPYILFSDTFKILLLKWCMTITTTGFYLAFFFAISHNFDEVKMFEKVDNSNFAKDQIESSCNVGGKILCYFNGGLNYQIEHHLFPRIAHWYYPYISPIVKDWCTSRGIRYTHYPSIKDNVAAMMIRLNKLGIDKNENKGKEHNSNSYGDMYEKARKAYKPLTKEERKKRIEIFFKENYNVVESVDFTSNGYKSN